MYEQITIKTLHTQGKKQTEIAKQMGCHRNTVRNIVKRKGVIDKQVREKASIFSKYQEKIKAWKDEKVTKRRMFEILQDEYAYTGSYDALCKYYKKHFPKIQEAYGVQITEPGEEAEIDFGYLGMLPDNNGKLIKTWGLAIVLAHSRAAYYQIVPDQTVKSLIEAITRAFTYFGGIPRKLKVDNMKTAILANQRYTLIFNQEFLEFASHHNMVIFPCTPYSPEQKGKVESGIKYMQTNFINGRKFLNLSDMEKQLANWMKNIANQRIHGTTRKIPWQELVTTERQYLLPIPENAYAFFERTVRKVGINCHIHFENNYYSIPSHLVGKEVTVRFTRAIVRVIFEGEQVALHARDNGQGNYVTQRTHLPEHKIYSTTEYQSRHEAKMANIGTSAHEYFTMLLATKESYWFRSVRVILGLVQEYGKEPVEKTLQRALYYKAMDMSTVKNILQKKLYLVEPESKIIQIDESSNSRDLTYYQI
jgi:transposase